MPISVYELAAESKFKHKKERKKHYMDLFSKNFKTLWLDSTIFPRGSVREVMRSIYFFKKKAFF